MKSRKGENNMAGNGVIKRLEWLIFNFPVTGNPKDETERLSNCINLYCQDAVGEINRQKAESERYLHSIKLLEKDVQTANAEIERLQAELEFKCDSCENIRLSREEYRKAISQAKSEAIKEFARELKCGVPQETGIIRCIDVDLLVKRKVCNDEQI